MSLIIEKIPKLKDEELLVLFHNAASKLSTEPNLAAERVIAAIEHEWKKRLDRARAGTYSTARPNDGMLATLGYTGQGGPSLCRYRVRGRSYRP